METRSIKRNRKNLIFADRKKNESGYAMVVVLGIVILTIGILSSMTMLTINDTQNSLKNIGGVRIMVYDIKNVFIEAWSKSKNMPSGSISNENIYIQI